MKSTQKNPPLPLSRTPRAKLSPHHASWTHFSINNVSNNRLKGASALYNMLVDVASTIYYILCIFFQKNIQVERERERERDNFTIKQEFVQKFLHNFLSHSPQFGEIVFWCVWRENSRAPPKFPPPLPPNQTLLPTIFCPIFSHPYFTSNQTHH